MGAAPDTSPLARSTAAVTTGSRTAGRPPDLRSLTELQKDQANYSLAWYFAVVDARVSALSNPLVAAYLSESELCSPVPASSPSPSNGAAELDWLVNDRLNDSQRRAVREALTRPVTIIQGPPGTGKTQVILELIAQIERAGSTAAVVAQNGAAIANVIQRVGSGDGHLRTLRSRVAELGNSAKRTRFSRRHPHWTFAAGPGGRETAISASRFLAEFPVVTSTIHSLPKLFTDGTQYLYDYVIVDEASQVDPVVGLVAMASGRRLILLGDKHQLPPVLDRTTVSRVKRLTGGLTHQHDASWVLREETSFLEAVEASSRRLGAGEVLLDTHYRCHPGIIDFCNRHVYGERLSVKTDTSAFFTKDVPVPIRVRWFPGAFGERVVTESAARRARTRGENPTSTRRNRKQVEVFMREEWPALHQRMEAASPEDPLSACILSPYRGQLEELRQALTEALSAPSPIDTASDDHPDGHAAAPSARSRLTADAISIDPVEPSAQREEDDDAPVNAPQALTIHTSQGREFDIVYVLPVDDGAWEFPWSQHRRLINVAASRAKQELVVVVGSDQMSEPLQQRLLGYSIPTRHAPPDRGPSNTRENGADQMFVQRLIDDVVERTGHDTAEDHPSGYGLQRSGLVSVFDQVSAMRERIRRAGLPLVAESGDGYAAPEEIVAQALLDAGRRVGSRRREDARETGCAPCERPGVIVIRELFLSSCHGLQHDGIDSRFFDIAIVHETTRRLLVAIEIDGPYHRHHRDPATLEAQRTADLVKDQIARDSGAAVIHGRTMVAAPEEPAFILLRLPSDGSVWGEFDEHQTASTVGIPSVGHPLAGMSIEALVEAQLSRSIAHPITVAACTLFSPYLASIGVSGVTSKQLHDRLADHGFLTYGPALDETPSTAAPATHGGRRGPRRPTAQGRDQGLRSCMAFNESGDAYWGVRVLTPGSPRLRDIAHDLAADRSAPNSTGGRT